MILHSIAQDRTFPCDKQARRFGQRLTVAAAANAGNARQGIGTGMVARRLWRSSQAVGGLAQHYGILASYPGSFFGLVALGGGIWHYHTILRAGRERGLTVFVGVQVAWAVVVLAQNGLFSS